MIDESKHTSGKISDDETARLREHDLKSPLVRMALAGFLYQEFRHDGEISPQAIHATIDKYVTAVDLFGEKATAAFNAGLRAKDFDGS